MASPTTTSPARPFTYQDLEGMPDDGYRREIIDGSLIVSPSPGFSHQLAAFAIARRLHGAQPPGVATVMAPFDVRAPAEDVVEPDVLVIRLEDITADDRLRKGAVPLLVVEVLSPSNRRFDLLTKRAVYEEAGVPAYWIVDPAVPSLLALRLVAGAYREEAEVAGADRLITDRPFPLDLAPAELVR